MSTPKKERQSFLTRAILISALLIVNVIVIYLYYYVLVFNTIEPGKVYGESTFNGGRYEVYTLKYYYQHNNITYFDKVDYVMGQDLQLGDSIALRVLRPYPSKHMVDKVFRDESKNLSYNCEDGFIVQYNEFINTFTDYEDESFSDILSPQGNTIHLSDAGYEKQAQQAIEVIDNIRFNRGSLVDYFILKMDEDSIHLRSVYHYLNDFSTDAMPSKMMYQNLSTLFPAKHLHISVFDTDNPKKERVLDPTW